MNISIDWLRELVELPQLKTDAQLQAFARQVTEHCFEVEKVHPAKRSGSSAPTFPGIFTALVLSAEKHPNADRLRVLTLQVGEGIVEPVVCGAWNFGAGDTVALALPGAHIPHDVHSDGHGSFTLETAKIRGIVSQGMLCSAFELGLQPEPEAAPEIMVLPKGTPHGKNLADILKSTAAPSNTGPMLELSLPPNRPDLYSHVGVARELGACLDLKLTPRFRKLTAMPKLPKTKLVVQVAIQDTGACRAYTALRMKVSVGESPKQIQEKLRAIGLRPVNNVVDITNLVMHEVGQPLHAFDAAHVQGDIVVRSAKQGEKITTIDHKERVLLPGMLVIADSAKALAIAGIMGGTGSEISSSTTEIILEAANFEPTSIRKTSRKIGLRTDGSGFWEKGLAPEQAVTGAALALEYLTQHAGALLIASSSHGKLATPPRSVTFTVEQINTLLGSSYSKAHVKKILSGFGFAISGSSKLKAALPYFRQDVLNYADFAEDMLKVTGLNEMPKAPLAISRYTVPENEDAFPVSVKHALSNLGFTETQTYSFISEADIAKLSARPEDYVKIKNPLSNDQGYLRQDLVASLLKNAAMNQRHAESFRIFEVGTGYFGYGRERSFAALAIVGKHATPELLLAEAKGAIERLAATFAPGKEVSYHPVAGTSDVTILVATMPVGTIKAAGSLPLRAFDVKYPAVYAHVELKALSGVSEAVVYRAVSRFPTVELDTSLVVDESVTWKQISDTVAAHGAGLVASVRVFEAAYLYNPDKLPEFHRKLAAKGKKNIAFTCVFASETRTFTDSEISPVYAKILAGLQALPGAEIR